MTEEGARLWIEARYGDEKVAMLERFAALLLEANAVQNLISTSTEGNIWVRHILDSAQLARLAPEAKSWLDVGSGAGLPGVVLAILTGQATLLVEPRRKRVEFLDLVIGKLKLDHVRVRQAAIDRVSGETFDAVTARAYAPLPEIFLSTARLTLPSTIWVLPKGRSAQRELDVARLTWQGVFHVEHSLTDGEAQIVVATRVQPRCV